MLATARKGYLATRRAADGHPYASMVLVATDTTGRPTFLISRLALHTQNLLADAKASLLIDATDATGDPLAGGRVTFIGAIHATDRAASRARFLASHPSAQSYASFADFGVYAMTVESAHLILGFGRIVTIPGTDLAAACAAMSQH
jgi:heme iron utilization protein